MTRAKIQRRSGPICVAFGNGTRVLSRLGGRARSSQWKELWLGGGGWLTWRAARHREEGIHMMSVITKFFGLSAAFVMAAMAFGVSSASASAASGSDVANCAFTGIVGGFNPPIPAASKFPIGLNQVGNYTFAGPATCVLTEGDLSDAPTNSGVYSVPIGSQGTYKNIVCGTARRTLRTRARRSSPSWGLGPRVAVPHHLRHHLRRWRGSDDDHRRLRASALASVTGHGFVLIVPQNGNCVTEDMNAFTVTGAFSIAAWVSAELKPALRREEGIHKMSTIKKMLCSAAVSIVAMAFGASSAAAADSATCWVHGIATNFYPPIPAANWFPIGQNQTGTYNLAAVGTCVAVGGDVGDGDGDSGIYDMTMTSTGQYRNTICGTADWHGVNPNATTINFAGAPATATPVQHRLQHPVRGRCWRTAVRRRLERRRSSLTGGGYVQLFPMEGNCIIEGVDDYLVEGVFTVLAS